MLGEYVCLNVNGMTHIIFFTFLGDTIPLNSKNRIHNSGEYMKNIGNSKSIHRINKFK